MAPLPAIYHTSPKSPCAVARNPGPDTLGTAQNGQIRAFRCDHLIDIRRRLKSRMVKHEPPGLPTTPSGWAWERRMNRTTTSPGGRPSRDICMGVGFCAGPQPLRRPCDSGALAPVQALWGAGIERANGFRSFLRSTHAPRGQTYLGLECIDLNSYRFKGSRVRRLSWFE